MFHFLLCIFNDRNVHRGRQPIQESVVANCFDSILSCNELKPVHQTMIYYCLAYTYAVHTLKCSVQTAERNQKLIGMYSKEITMLYDIKC
jgi:hypothetical protein